MTKWTRVTSDGRNKDCWFCRVCGSRLYHHCPGQELLTVKAGALVDLSEEMLSKGVHIWAKVSLGAGEREVRAESVGEDGARLTLGVESNYADPGRGGEI